MIRIISAIVMLVARKMSSITGGMGMIITIRMATRASATITSLRTSLAAHLFSLSQLIVSFSL